VFVIKEVRESQIAVIDTDTSQTLAIGNPSGGEITNPQIQGTQLVGVSPANGQAYAYDLTQYPGGAWRPLG
jgi:hypothetical protein